MFELSDETGDEGETRHSLIANTALHISQSVTSLGPLTEYSSRGRKEFATLQNKRRK